MDRRARGESFKLLLVRVKSLDRRARGENQEYAETLCLPARRERATNLKLSARSAKTRRAPR